MYWKGIGPILNSGFFLSILVEDRLPLRLLEGGEVQGASVDGPVYLDTWVVIKRLTCPQVCQSFGSGIPQLCSLSFILYWPIFHYDSKTGTKGPGLTGCPYRDVLKIFLRLTTLGQLSPTPAKKCK